MIISGRRTISRSIAVCITGIMVMLGSGCAWNSKPSPEAEDTPESEVNSMPSADTSTEYDKAMDNAYSTFTPQALEGFIGDYYYYDQAQSEDIKLLGSGTTTGNGVIDITETDNDADANSYDILFFCKQHTSSRFSISLKRGAQLHQIIDVGECPGTGVVSTSLPVHLLPRAQQVVIRADTETSLVMVVHEITNTNKEES